MLGKTARQQAVTSIATKVSVPFSAGTTKTPEELYGSDVFGLAVMKAHLPRHVYKSLKRTIDSGAALDPSTADVVAAAMKDWAVSTGATHYAHVFQPLTGATA